jgi:oligopeptide transport system ATP-binding protein
MTDKILLRVENLQMYFPASKSIREKNKKYVKAVDGVSFSIQKGKTLGLVGESGCGKTTVGRTILKLYEPTGGNIIYDGTDISHFNDKEMLPYRKKMQMIFQDPYTSLDPRKTVGDIIGEPLTLHNLCKGNEKEERIQKLVEMVGLKSDHINRYPHEFSGGQRQRIGIARALAVEPEFIVCDEPISALDVSIQAQIVNLLSDFQSQYGFTYLFISHDLSMIRHISDSVGVMYLGRLMEYAPTDELYNHVKHPYTRSLLSAIPVADPIAAKSNQRMILKGDVPSPINPPTGCPFHTRCPVAERICAEKTPKMKDIGNGHLVACHLA